jgi:branched-chain amino acid transport system permease protein
MGQILIYGFITGTQVLLIALALYLVHLVSRVINIALGAIAATGAYALYAGVAIFHWPLSLSIIFAVIVLLILAGINYWLNEGFTKKQEYLLALLTSFAFSLVLESAIAIIFGTDGKSFSAGITAVVQFGAYQIPFSGLGILIAGIIILLITFFAYSFTPVGRILRAISQNTFAAISLGINQPRVRLLAYMGAALIAGTVGSLVGFNTALVPNLGFNLVVMAFCALLVGGADDLRGTVIAAYVLGFVPHIIIGLAPGVSDNWRMALVFIIAAGFLMLRPHGMFTKEKRII